MTAATTDSGRPVSERDESVPDGTFGGTYRASTAPANLPPVTPEQAANNLAALEAAITPRRNHEQAE